MSFKKINKIRKSKRTRLVCICACLLLLLAGCKNTVSATPDSEDNSNNSSTVSETNPVSETSGSSATSETNQDNRTATPSVTETPSATVSMPPAEETASVLLDFTADLFRYSAESDLQKSETQNTLISPISVLYAAGMISNGAKGNTLSQFEAATGVDNIIFNSFLKEYHSLLTRYENCYFNLANSIWINEDKKLDINEEFYNTNREYCNAEVSVHPFDDTIITSVNDWVSNNTNGLIDNMLNNVPEDPLICVINAAVFNASWQKQYMEEYVSEGIFTTSAGVEKTVEYMYGSEYSYIETEDATGFMKYYSGGRYAFMAVLPDENTDIHDYISSFSAGKLTKLFENCSDSGVLTAIPKFTANCDYELKDTLEKLGITDAFNPETADFTGICSDINSNIYIAAALHKTAIDMNEKGTTAAAATVMMPIGAGSVSENAPKVYLDRPFIYMIVDCEYKLPVFIGTVMEP